MSVSGSAQGALLTHYFKQYRFPNPRNQLRNKHKNENGDNERHGWETSCTRWMCQQAVPLYRYYHGGPAPPSSTQIQAFKYKVKTRRCNLWLSTMRTAWVRCTSPIARTTKSFIICMIMIKQDHMCVVRRLTHKLDDP